MGHKLVALDVGDVRIGLAAGEEGRSFAFGRGFLTRQTLALDLQALAQLAEAENAHTFVVGLPRNLDGSDSVQTQKVRAFAAELGNLGYNVHLEDERLTTRLAASNIVKSGLGRQKRREKGRLDERAAVLILESYLARWQLEHPPAEFPGDDSEESNEEG